MSLIEAHPNTIFLRELKDLLSEHKQTCFGRPAKRDQFSILN